MPEKGLSEVCQEEEKELLEKLQQQVQFQLDVLLMWRLEGWGCSLSSASRAALVPLPWWDAAHAAGASDGGIDAIQMMNMQQLIDR